MPKEEIISPSERESLLKSTLTFRNLSVTEINQLATIIHEVSYEPGEPIVIEGDLIDAVYIIARGKVEVTKEVELGTNKGSTFLAVLNEGETIGLNQTGLYSETGRRTATVKATEKCLLLKLDLKEFNTYLTSHPHLLETMRANTDLTLKMRFIKESTPFMQLSNQRIAWLASSVKEIFVPHDKIIFNQGDPVDNCYMIIEGIVEISTVEDDGTFKVENTLTTGQLFGERAIFKTAKRVATTRAITDCRLMVLGPSVLQELHETMGDASEQILWQSPDNQPIRKENIVHHQRTLADKQVITVLKDPIRNQYLQLTDEGWFIWQQMDGKATVQNITKAYSEHFQQSYPPALEIINNIVRSGFAKADIMQSETFVSVEKKQAEKGIFKRFPYIYSFRNADKKIETLYRYGGFLFTNIPALIIISFIIIAGLSVFSYSLNHGLAKIHTINHLILFLISLIFVSCVLHLFSALAKALTIKRFGNIIPSFKLGFYLIFPIAYVDTSDLWMSSRVPRVTSMLSGIICTLFVASLLSIYLYFIPNSTMLPILSLSSTVLYFVALRALNPLLDSDGYHTLINAFDSPKLREYAFAWLAQGMPEFFSLRKSDLTLRMNKLYFLYYLFYIALNFIFVFVIQYQFNSYGVTFIWNGWVVYLLLAAGLLIEFIIEFNHQKKLNFFSSGIA